MALCTSGQWCQWCTPLQSASSSGPAPNSLPKSSPKFMPKLGGGVVPCILQEFSVPASNSLQQ